MRVVAGCTVGAAVAAWMLSAPAGAQISLSPSANWLAVRPGSTKSYQAAVGNKGNRSHACEMRVQPAGMTEDGRLMPVATSARGAEAWVSVSPETFTLAPKESRSVKVIVKPPTDASGGYSALVSCYIPGDTPPGRGATIQLGHVMHSVLLVTVPGRNMRLRAEAGQVRMAKGADGLTQVSARLNNSGDLHLWVSGTASLLGPTGRVVQDAPFQTGRGLLMPGHARVFQASLARAVGDGIYTVRAEFFLGSRTRLAAGSETFTVDKGKIAAGRPTPEQEGALLAAMPRLDLSRWRAHYDITSGGQRFDTVMIRNVTSETIQLLPRLMFWDLDKHADLFFGTQNSYHGRDGMQFLSFSPEKLTLGPGRQAKVTYTIRFPRGVTGEFYPALVFEEEGRPLPKDQRLVRQRALVLSMAVKGKCDRRVQLGEMRFKPVRAGGGTLSVEVKCTGNAGAEIEGHAEISDPAGKTVGEPKKFGGPGVVLLPGSRATFDVPFPYRMEPGRWGAHVSVSQVGKSASAATADCKFEIGEK